MVARRYAELTGLDERVCLRTPICACPTRGSARRCCMTRTRSSRYDGRVAGYDLDRMNDEETFVVDDAWLDPAYSSLCNAYLRDELGWNRRRSARASPTSTGTPPSRARAGCGGTGCPANRAGS